MNPTRKRRMIAALLVLLAAAVATTLVVMALNANASYLFTPQQIHDGEAPESGIFRLGGLVQQGSVRREAGSLDVSFLIPDTRGSYPVTYHGILPDLFREGQSVIAEGQIENSRFVARSILAKHDETYRPVELEKQLREERERREADEARGQPASNGNPSP